jgi:hypothetical protein
MANDEREREREFLDGLKARTGRDLAEWMAAIASQGFTDKNDIIDWLRGQGLPFARASWLERIHRNGGRPIHAAPSGEAPKSRVPTAAAPAPQTAPVQPVLTAADISALEKLLSAAKGYRPLYHLLEDGIRKAVPGVAFSPQARYVSVGAPREFAAITVHATEVRLGLDLGDRAFGGRLEKAKLRGPGPAITHMIVLTDARQVDDDLLALIESARRRANP